MILNDDAFFHILAEPVRRRMLVLLLEKEELTVTQLYLAVDEPQPKISRYLGMMRDCKIVNSRQEGHHVYYRINEHLPMWAALILQKARQGNEARREEDISRLRLRMAENMN